ncbi:MAG: aldehyde ferredoxin oxidoreductase C-terminal domain-containing protein, partial [Deltaproteobacteria bacterium]|nr:aldehyde ferredoxin oxidoreductase C-terminal domain-containing protein [Deltaproteobacteria bacterium]
EPAKVMKHVQWYADYFSSITGIESGPEDLIIMSEGVYNFQRIFNLRMGFGRREHDALPYRAVGPVTETEYESRDERYDKQLSEIYKFDIDGKSTAEKLATLRKHREEQYDTLKDAVYKRRGWTNDGIPTLKTARRLGIDFDDVVELLKANGVNS